MTEALTMMTEARLEHYDAAGLPTVRQRLTTMLNVALSCLEAGEADEIIAYMTRIGRERFSAGYDLLEVQTSANVVEEALWRRIPSSRRPGGGAPRPGPRQQPLQRRQGRPGPDLRLAAGAKAPDDEDASGG